MNYFEKIMDEANELPEATAPAADDEGKLAQEIKKLISEKEKEVEFLKQSLLLDENSIELRQAVGRFLTKNEMNYLQGKVLSTYIRKDPSVPPFGDWYESYGKPDAFPAKLLCHEEQHFEFILPPLSGKRIDEKKAGDGKAISYLVLYLIQEYEKENGKVPMLKHPTVIFEHYVSNSDSGCRVPDPDNLEIKSILDSMQNYFYDNDSILDITLIQCGKIADSSQTRIHVIGPGCPEKSVPKGGKQSRRRTKITEE